ncbi:hypothetical protein BDV98DRAFT_581311 [Pterulicium gracile]|uniref:Uncharacterized protein n=1 Tax=Pterulicium gracile TaxID=1884261 RepID=A0A5C3QNZ8_9AGAR|nr:hypothetical protein BDV98DRAFT_581311 [Pterula gracilis]
MDVPGYECPDSLEDRGYWSFSESEDVILEKLKEIEIHSLGVDQCGELVSRLKLTNIVAERHILQFTNSRAQRNLLPSGDKAICKHNPVTHGLLADIAPAQIESLNLTQDEPDEISVTWTMDFRELLRNFSPSFCPPAAGIRHLELDHLTLAKVLPVFCDQQWYSESRVHFMLWNHSPWFGC